MLINEITLIGTSFVAANSKKLVHNTNTIFYYSKGEPLVKNWTYETDIEYPYKDDRGRYRTHYGGRQNERGIKGIIKEPHMWIKKGDHTFYKKQYEGSEDLNRPYTTDWYFKPGRAKYPTEKPYKLLERIICLSTK